MAQPDNQHPEGPASPQGLLDYEAWAEKYGDELSIKAAETGADREGGFNIEDYLGRHYFEDYLKDPAKAIWNLVAASVDTMCSYVAGSIEPCATCPRKITALHSCGLLQEKLPLRPTKTFNE